MILAITVHEFAHAASATAAGDDTSKRMGRLSLNPLDHFEPVGFMMIVLTSIFGFGIGWGKPVPVNPNRFKSPRWDDVKVSAWGPLSNIIMATFAALILRTSALALPQGLFDFLIVFLLVNISLAVFNMIPLPPLDGSHILAGLLPRDASIAYSRFGAQYGMAILVALLVLPVGNGSLIRMIIGPPAFAVRKLLLGV